jgi:single-stranded DNA-binding protein
MNILTVSGTVISADFKDASEMKNSQNDLLRIKMNVRTGERKKDGEEYAPSYILSVPIWGKFATAIKDKVVKGSKMCISGTLAAPTTYDGADGVRVNMELSNVSNDSFQLFDGVVSDTDGEPEVKAATATKESKKEKAKKSLLDGDEETADELDDDIPF